MVGLRSFVVEVLVRGRVLSYKERLLHRIVYDYGRVICHLWHDGGRLVFDIIMELRNHISRSIYLFSYKI